MIPSWRGFGPVVFIITVKDKISELKDFFTGLRRSFYTEFIKFAWDLFLIIYDNFQLILINVIGDELLFN